MASRVRPSTPPPARRVDAGFLRSFDAAARTGSFTAAARELSLTQSAVSRQIQSLEAEVGVELFARDGPRIRLSPAGERLAAALRPALGAIDSAVAELRRAKLRPRVRITTFASFASLWLMPRLPLFQAAHPDVDIEVEASDRLADLDATGQDIALRAMRESSPMASAPGTRLLFAERIAPVCSPRLLARLRARGGLRTPRDLARTTLISEVAAAGSSGAYTDFLDRLTWKGWFEGIGQAPVEPVSWLHFSFTHQAVQAALAGMGVAMGQMALVGHLVKDGSLVMPLGSPQASRVNYYLAQREGTAGRPELAAFVAWLESQLAQPPDG